MKIKSLANIFIAIAMVMTVALACNNYGKKLSFNGGDLYYTDKVQEADANKLGNYLVEQKFFDGKEKTVQLDKNGSTYQVKMVVQEGKDKDESYAQIAKQFAGEVSSDVFGNAPTEIHLCDNQLKTLRVVSK